MPRYHFSLMNGQEVLDTSGKELPDKESAQKEARSMLEGFKHHFGAVRIRDAAGRTVDVVRADDDDE
jgi:hypothetical protein